jgi:type 2 lantibiotic biosynthesis protein LanM
MLLQHTTLRQACRAGSASHAADERFARSVLVTGLLPCRFASAAGAALDLSGLGVDPRAARLRERWLPVNTDAMDRVLEPLPAPCEGIAAWPDGTPLQAGDHVADLIGGFRHMYDLLLSHREALLAPDGPIPVFGSLQVRHIFRMTRLYADLLSGSLGPLPLESGLTRSIYLGALFRPFLNGEQQAPLDIAAAEVEALERGDIPLFTAWADRCDVVLDDGTVVERALGEASFTQALQNFGSMSGRERDAQCALIRAAFRAAPQFRAGSAAGLPRDRCEDTEDAVLLDLAHRVQVQLGASAIRGEDGSATWLALDLDPLTGIENLRPLDDHLYGGRGGIALFLAAHHAVTGAPEARALAFAALAEMRHDLLDGRLSTPGTLADGIAGSASFLYVLSHAGALLRHGSLTGEAGRAAGLLLTRPPDRGQLDVMSGAAGTILALLALHRATGSATVLAGAEEYGDLLVATRAAADGGPGGWHTIAAAPLTGFSHGAAGIAHALLRLAAVTRRPDFAAAAVQGLAYERAEFDSAVGNWRDLRDHRATPGSHAFACAWCNGAVGIGLQRVAALDLLDDPRLRAEIDVAVAAALADTRADPDHLCCGAMGRALFLFEAGRRIRQPDLVRIARARACEIARRNPCANATADCADSPNLFRGAAGIGYGLLRMVRPDIVPNVLVLDPQVLESQLHPPAVVRPPHP